MSDPQKTPEEIASGRVADATERNWVDRWAPPVARPYLRLSRADRPIGTWLLLLPCWWALLLAIWTDPQGYRSEDFWLFFAFAAGAFLMRGAGCTWNDIADRKIDAQVERTRSRPIPSGQVSVAAAAVWMGIQAALGLAILLSFNPFAILLGIASLVPALIYPFAKRFTWWPQVFLGLAFNWGALLGWAAHHGSLSLAPFALYVAGILWTLFYDTIYALQDVEDDALIGVKSTARLFGKQTKKWLFGFAIGTLIMLTLAVFAAFKLFINPVSLVIALMAIWAFGWHLAWQLLRLDITAPTQALYLFRSNRDTGLILVVGLLCAIFAQSL